MIMRIIRTALTLLVYWCVATVLAEAILLVSLAGRWHLDRAKAIQMLAIAQGIDLWSMKEQAVQEQETAAEQASLEQILEARATKVRHLELREQALQQGLDQFRTEQRKLAEEKKRLKQMRESFDAELAATEQGATATGADEVRRTLETIKPKQAKEQILRMLENKELDQVVVLLGGMADAKRARIISEFKSAEEMAQLGEILRRIREGLPKAALAGDTRQKLTPPKIPNP